MSRKSNSKVVGILTTDPVVSGTVNNLVFQKNGYIRFVSKKKRVIKHG